MSAIPVPEPGAPRQRIVLRGDVPSPIDPPTGCRFHTRCVYAQADCAQRQPTLEAVAPKAAVACRYWRDLKVA